ncbi:MAG TPA: transporter [Candidatus Coprenecus stercoravium]|uniref:Transporter n=1 Tax=Candidatus Coprenecus stercoravium TaxID=2840735 RepID=A0A9D2KBE6_9BACT|nr:transporter [Candidatus Coprenecus stercoravium]
MMRLIKDWALPLAMAAGAMGYFVFHYVGFLAPLKPAVWVAVDILTPSLIFIQLFLTFCKIDFKDLRLTHWHWIILAFQFLSSLAMASVLMFVPMNEVYREIFEGAMVCLICPTATAAAVVTDKLGGSAARITVYNLMSNILAAAFVPIVFPLVEVRGEAGFVVSFLKILSKVFPLLICPFLLALLLKYIWPRAHAFFRSRSGVAFYLWAVALALAIGQTVRSLHNSTAPALVLWLIAGAALLSCIVQYWFGKRTGQAYGDTITAGQALGQKNTVLAIWMAYTYLNPISSLAPGTYAIWQNLFNSWQLWRRNHKKQDKISGDENMQYC